MHVTPSQRSMPTQLPSPSHASLIVLALLSLHAVSGSLGSETEHSPVHFQVMRREKGGRQR